MKKLAEAEREVADLQQELHEAEQLANEEVADLQQQLQQAKEAGEEAVGDLEEQLQQAAVTAAHDAQVVLSMSGAHFSLLQCSTCLDK